MKNLTKIEWIKVGLLTGYLLTLFIPVYSKTAFGNIYKVSIVGLNAGSFFLIASILVITLSIFTYIYQIVLHKYAYFSMLGFMFILLFMLLFLKEKESSIRSAFYIQVILVGLLSSAYFFESWTIKLFDTLYHYLLIILRFINKWIAKLRQTIREKRQLKKKVTTHSDQGDDVI